MVKKEKKGVYEKAFTRDFTLAMLEIWYKSEAHNLKQWSGKKQKHLPYIIFWRTDGTVKSFYDQNGINWVKREIKNHIKKHDDFLKKLEDNVRDKLKSIQHIYEKEKTLSKEKLCGGFVTCMMTKKLQTLTLIL